MASLQGMNIDALEQSVLVIVRMVSYLLDSGSFVIKSKAIVSNGQAFSAGVMGNKGGWLGWVLTLVIWQVAQPLMYYVTKVFMFGHQ